MAILHNTPFPVGQRVNCAHCGAEWTVEHKDGIRFDKPDLAKTDCPVCGVTRYIGRNGAKEPAAKNVAEPTHSFHEKITGTDGKKGVRVM